MPDVEFDDSQLEFRAMLDLQRRNASRRRRRDVVEAIDALIAALDANAKMPAVEFIEHTTTGVAGATDVLPMTFRQWRVRELAPEPDTTVPRAAWKLSTLAELLRDRGYKVDAHRWLRPTHRRWYANKPHPADD